RAFSEAERQLDRVGDAPARAFFHDDAIDHHIEIVRAVAVENDVVAEIDALAVDAHAHEAFTPQPIDLDLELAAARAAYRSQDRGARTFAAREDAIDDLLRRLRLDALAAVRAVRGADARAEEPQVSADLGDRAHRGARILGELPLLDGDRGAQALDGFD